MLHPTEVYTLMMEGRPLPQEQFDDIPDGVCEVIWSAETDILNSTLRAVREGGNPLSEAMIQIGVLSGQYGWFPACSVVGIAAAQRFGVDDVPDLPDLGEDIASLLRTFALAASLQAEDEGAWTIPIAMLVSLGEERAHTFTTGSICCAAMKVLKELKDK